jgi:hypothetical protein
MPSYDSLMCPNCEHYFRVIWPDPMSSHACMEKGGRANRHRAKLKHYLFMCQFAHNYHVFNIPV